ncbi:hypothetical protein HD554DRAFT_1998983, partial [Boletus coccyginus]
RRVCKVIDTIDSLEYISGEISDDDLDIPAHMIPPTVCHALVVVLPSQVHPSYPYGNPTNIKHPAARPRPPYDPTSRALFEDMGYGGGGVNGVLCWKDPALEQLLRAVDEEKEVMKRATEARKMANGATGQAHHHPPPQPPPPPADAADQTIEEEPKDEDEGDEDEDE